MEHYSGGRFDAALEVLASSGKNGAAPLEDYFLLFRAKALLQLEKADSARELFRALRTKHPDTSRLQDSVLGEVQALLKIKQPENALDLLQTAKIEEDAEVLYFRGRAQEEAGQREAAMAAYLKVISKYAASKSADQAEERLQSLLPRYWLRAANFGAMTERAGNLIRAGRNRDARTLLGRMGQVKAPNAFSAATRLILLAQADFNLGKASTILPILKEITPSFPSLHAQALYLRAGCARRMGFESTFLETKDAALKAYPQSPFTEKILWSVASYFDIKGRTAEAQAAYREVSTRFPQGEGSDRASWRAAIMAYNRDQTEEALQGFCGYLVSYPGTRVAATLYWMGRCCLKLGDPVHASDLFARARVAAGEGYYGARALEAEKTIGPGMVARMAAAAESSGLGKLPELRAPADPAIPPASATAIRGIERARLLASAGLYDLALFEIRCSAKLCPDDLAVKYAMSRIHQLKGDYFNSIVTMRRAFPDYDSRPLASLPPEVWNLLLPSPHRTLIETHSARNGLDPNLVLGLIRQESAFSAEAHSPADARGLMQVLPGTGRALARSAGMTRFTAQKLYNPEINIALGTKHFASLLQRFDRKVELALAAYNAGEDRTRHWMQDFGEIEMADFVERIPFSETRDYVKQVMTNASLYRMLDARR